jgi:hypothetical protein
MRIFLSSLVCVGASGLLAASMQVRAADPVPPPPPMPEASRPAVPDLPPSSKAETKPTNVKGTCVNCAVIRSIRQIERERASPRQMPNYISSPEYRDTLSFGEQPLVGPVVGLSFGPGSTNNKPYVGAAGSPAMRQRLMQISYEVILRFDDGRYGLLELDDVSDFRAGDHVRVVDNLLEPLPR